MRRNVLVRIFVSVTTVILTVLVGIGIYHFRTYHNNPIVLEVYTDCRGITYPRGKVLDFRLYRDGRIEYDDYPSQESAEFHYRYWFPQTHRYINQDDVNKLLELVSQADFLNAQAEYPAAGLGIDSEFRTTISSSYSGIRKSIVVVDYYGDDGVGSYYRYPPSLRLLLQKTNQLRGR